MNLELAQRRHPGNDPFEEAWFIEGSLDEERAFWLRYTLSHTAEGATCAVWAAVVEGDLVQAVRVPHILVAQPDDALLHTPSGTLTPERATGRVGPLQWDLRFSATGAHDHLPARLARLGLSGRHYASPGLDLAVTGSLAVGDVSLTLHRAPAVLGHIWGRRANTRAWAWAHCGAFDRRPDLTFEALSARLQVGGATLPWATSAVVQIGEHTVPFTRTRGLFLATSHVHERYWVLDIEQGQARVRARIDLPGQDHTVRVGLRHANARRTRVLNSPLARVRLHLSDPRVGDVRVESTRCSLELARAGEVEGAVHLVG